MEKENVIAIDYGTQSVRVAIIDKNGKFLAFEQEKYEEPYFSPKPGYAEQEPDYYYDCMCKAAQRLTKNNQELLGTIKSLSSTCFRDSAAYLDKDYKSIRPSIIWLDQRQAELKKKLKPIHALAFKLVGMEQTIILNRKRTPAIWLQENEPENRKKIEHYAPLNSYFNYRMTRILADSASNMTGHFPIDYKNRKWYKKGAMKGDLFNIPPKLMPTIVEVGSIIGNTTEKCFEETGIPAGIPYIATGNDKSCEALGCGAIDENCAHVSYGTSSSIAIVKSSYFEPEPFLPSYSTCFKGAYTGEVQIYRGYWMLKWFINEFGGSDNLEASIESKAAEEVLNEKILNIPAGSDGLILQPYWGPGLSRPLAKGGIIGFFDVHTRYHIYRAIIEGIGYGLKEGLMSIEKRGKVKAKYITVAGGGSKSDAICQITADLFNLPVLKSETYENSSLGCAMAQYVSDGTYKNVEEAKKYMVRHTKTFTPNPKIAAEYEYLFEKAYLKMYPALKDIYKNLTDLKNKKNK